MAAQAAQATVHWRPTEHSLARESFNSLVSHGRVDATDIMIREASMGRQAELGPEWCPPGLLSRRVAGRQNEGKVPGVPISAIPITTQQRATTAPVGATRQRPGTVTFDVAAPRERRAAQEPGRREARGPGGQGAPDLGARPQTPPVAMPLSARAGGGTLSAPVPAPPQSARVERSGPARLAPAPAPLVPQGSPKLATGAPEERPAWLRPVTAPTEPRPRLGQGGLATVHWRPNEQALRRESFNAVVNRRICDVSEVMMCEATMGRQAERGPDWCPPGLVAQRLADAEALAKEQRRTLRARR